MSPLILRSAGTAAALFMVFAVSTNAQSSNALALRSSLSISVIQTRPQGALGRNIDFGYGANAAYQFRIDKSGFLSLRADLGVVDYGNESKRTALSETVGDRIQVNVRTRNYIIPISVGPQLTWPTGVIRPYVNAGVGGQAFFTESDAESSSDHTTFASTTNQSDFTSLWTAGGGIYVPVVAGKTNVQLDMGLQYLSGGRARYLTPEVSSTCPAATWRSLPWKARPISWFSDSARGSDCDLLDATSCDRALRWCNDRGCTAEQRDVRSRDAPPSL